MSTTLQTSSGYDPRGVSYVNHTILRKCTTALLQTVDTRPLFFVMSGLGTRLVPRALTCQRSLRSEMDHVSGNTSNRTLFKLWPNSCLQFSSAIRRAMGRMDPGFETVRRSCVIFIDNNNTGVQFCTKNGDNNPDKGMFRHLCQNFGKTPVAAKGAWTSRGITCQGFIETEGDEGGGIHSPQETLKMVS